MSMINKLKQFKDLREQGKKMQDALSDESSTINEGGVTITMNGNLEMTGIAIDKDMLDPNKKEKLENNIKNAHKNALKKMQRIMAGKMKEMGGFNLPGMS